MTPGENEDRHSARKALESAQNSFEEAAAQETRVHRVVSALRALRQQNHFGESIERAMMRRRST